MQVNYKPFKHILKSKSDELINLLFSELKGDEKRLRHSIAVAHMAEELASIYHILTPNLVITALFHDVCKNYNHEQYTQLLGDNYLKTIKDCDLVLLHGIAGAKFIHDKLGINEVNLKTAVYYHTVGHPNFDLSAKIVFLSDKIDDTRTYPEVSEIRKIAKVNLDCAISLYFKYNKAYLKSHNKLEHPISIAFQATLLK